MLHLANHIHEKFELSSFYPDGLIFDHFSSKYQNFLKKISKFSNSKKNPQKLSYFSPTFKPSSIFTKIPKVILIFLTPEFALKIPKFQNSEYEVHQSSPTDEG
jgi:hypothetical protein